MFREYEDEVHPLDEIEITNVENPLSNTGGIIN